MKIIKHQSTLERLAKEFCKEMLLDSHVIVDGHFRTVNGKRVYVKPYLRKR